MKKQLINLEPVKELVREKLLDKYDNTLFMNTTKVELKIDIEDILNDYIEQQNIIEPTVYITTNAYIKMRLLVDKHDKEIGWYGTVTKMPGLDNTYVIDDIIVYPQLVTATTVEQDDDKMFEFETSLTTDQVNRKRFHGHSHVNMATSPSGVDEQFYQDILSQVEDYFIITITNKRNDYTTRFYDVTNNILYEDVPIELIQEDGSLYSLWYDKNIEDNINKRETAVTTTAVFKTKEQPKHKDKNKKKIKQRSFFDDEPTFYDPYIRDHITKEDYFQIYGIPYEGEYDIYKGDVEPWR